MMTVQDDRGSRKKAWKAFQANYDDVFALSDRLCSYCLTDQMVEALLTMTEFLKWPTRWISTTGEIDAAAILNLATQLEYRLMNGCCDDNLPIQYRYSDTGVLERSMNGGNDWMPAPEYDPRVYSPQFPPMPGDDGDDKKCLAAAGAAALVKAQVGQQITDEMTRYTLAELITDWVGTLIGSSNPFQALVTVVANQIFALVLSALVPALTDDVYDKFKCALYCTMGDDATFNQAQWSEARTKITDDIGGIAGIFLEHLVYLLGTGGTTNLVRAGGAAEADCSDCDCDPATCEDKYGEFSNYGEIIERGIDPEGHDYIVVESYSLTPAGEAAGIAAIDYNDCCEVYVTYPEGHEPSGGNVYYATCGEIPNPDALNHSGGPDGGCYSMRARNSLIPFQIRFTFLPCD